jgi:RHS repeat-associated protein
VLSFNFHEEYGVCLFAPQRRASYAGGQRIASNLTRRPYQGITRPSENPDPPAFPFIPENNVVLHDLKDIIDLWDGVLGNNVPTFQDLRNMQLPTRAPYQTELCAHYNDEVHPDIFPHGLTDSMSTLDHINCLCRNGENAYVWQTYYVFCHSFEELYFYHPDYLSNTEYVTDAGGYVYQYLFYSPFGESLYSQHAQTGEYNTPHRFNAKELDEETGLYYYGARYYNPMVSVWLGVDPLASVDPDFTPYHFVNNNPIMIIDPDGLTGYELNHETGELTKASGENANLGGDEYDVIIASNGDQQRVDKGVVNKNQLSIPTAFNDGSTGNVTVLDVSDMNRGDATDLYKWICNHTEDSYKLTHFGAITGGINPKDKRFISSSHLGRNSDGTESEKSGEVVRNMMSGQGYFQTQDVFSVGSESTSNARENSKFYAREIQIWNEDQKRNTTTKLGNPIKREVPKIKCYYYIRGVKGMVRYN